MDHADQYAAIMQKMLADNAAAAEAVVAGARAEQLAAAADLQTAREELAETQRNAGLLLQEYTDRRREHLEKRLREEVKREVALRLLKKREPVATVADLLDLEVGDVREAARRAGLRPAGLPGAWLEYEEQGRSGYVVFCRDQLTLRFAYEFGAGRALAVIEIPKADLWEAQTGLPLAEREAVLEFIGMQVVADKAPEYAYRIDDQAIVVYI